MDERGTVQSLRKPDLKLMLDMEKALGPICQVGLLLAWTVKRAKDSTVAVVQLLNFLLTTVLESSAVSF